MAIMGLVSGGPEIDLTEEAMELGITNEELDRILKLWATEKTNELFDKLDSEIDGNVAQS